MNGKIYLYRNKLNGRTYVGQTTVSLAQRHCNHLYHNSYFDRALRECGPENFELTVLADGIQTQEELDALEIFYIEKYQSYYDGYNLTKGGQRYRKSSIEKSFAEYIAKMILETKLTFREIGALCECSIYVVSDVNIGDGGYELEGYQYPLRKYRATAKYSEDQWRMIQEYLIHTDFTFKKIASLLDVDLYTVEDINRGKRYRRKELDYPIRKNPARTVLTKELVDTIVKLLKEDELSANQIGAKLGIPGYTVGQINRGKSAWCKTLDETFPIRKKQYKNRKAPKELLRKLSDQDILEISDMLQNTNVNIEEIAKRFNVSRATIDRINQGKKWQEVTKGDYPLRRNNKHNLVLNE